MKIKPFTPLFSRIAALLIGSACLFAASIHAATTVTKSTAAAAFALIDGTKQTYTHAYNFNNWPGMNAVVTNGVTFTNVGGPAGADWPVVADYNSRNETGGWTSTAKRPTDLSISPNTSNNAYSIIARNPSGSIPTDAFERMFHGWIYNANTGNRITTFTLSGLEEGSEYSLTLYYSLNTGNNASITFASNQTADTPVSLEGNAITTHADYNSVTYNYIAGDDGKVSFTFTESNGGFRLYALTNSLTGAVPEPSTYGLMIGALTIVVYALRRRLGQNSR